jgi:putative transposon-encoded protein
MFQQILDHGQSNRRHHYTYFVTQSGNGAHLFVPKEWLGKTVKIILVE